MPRSGTTLVEQILASHPDVHGAGELALFERTAASVRASLSGAPAFPAVVRDMSGEHLQELGARYVTALRQLAPGAKRITDKMPSNFFFAGLIHLALPNATIIHVVRDPADTCMSCFARHFVKGQLHTYDLAELGRCYRRYETLMAHWHRALPRGRILDVRYEALVGDLEGVTRRVLAHCGLTWDPCCLDFYSTERSVRTASATQVRQPIYQNSVGRWRRYEAFVAPLLAELSAHG
jgi:Sulfotransferase family